MSRNITLKSLSARLRMRGRAKDKVWCLDLRQEAFGMLGRLTLRDPGHPHWPKKGRTTSDQKTAERWLEERYLSYVRAEAALKAGGGSGTPAMITEACDRFIADLSKTLGADHNTVANWRSVFNVHVKPALGNLPLTALDTPRVRAFLEGLEVTRRKHGKIRKEPAGFRTRTNVRTALQALWRHFHKDVPPPFGAIHLENDDRKRLIRDAAKRGELFLQDTPDTYSSAEILEILAHAMAYDHLVITGRPNIAATVIPNTAEVIALQLGFATRIEELMALRWRQVLENPGIARIPGTKNDNAWRWVPIQDCVRPWLTRLRSHAGEPAPNDYVVRTDPRPRGQGRKPSKKTYQSRISRVLTRARLKYNQELTHIFRATHITWATANGYPNASLRRWIGHAISEEQGAFGAYIDPDRVARDLTPRDRTYLVGLPSPDECAARALEILREAEK